MFEKWIDELLKNKLFKDIEREELENILKCLRPNIKTYKKKDIITIEGDKLNGIGIVLDGEVIVGKENLSGDRVIMSKLKKGEMFGEVAAFSSGIWLATVVANMDSTILFFPPQKIVGVCSKMCTGHRRLIQNMLQIVSKKALILNNKIEIISLKSIRKKVSTYLLQQYAINNTSTFYIPLKRHQLAEYLLVSRPSLSRELINMREEGIIDFDRNCFKILDIEKLKACLQ